MLSKFPLFNKTTLKGFSAPLISLTAMNKHSFAVNLKYTEEFHQKAQQDLIDIHSNINQFRSKDYITTIGSLKNPTSDVRNWFGGLSTKFDQYIKSKKDRRVSQVSSIMEQSIDSSSLRTIFQMFNYTYKLEYPKIIFAFVDQLKLLDSIPEGEQRKQVENKIIKYATCLEYITMGHFLHNKIEYTKELKSKVGGVSSLLNLSKYLNNGKILLAGDFFHTKASKLSSEIGIAEIPYYLAVIEECLAKAMITEQSIVENKQKINTEQLLNVIYNETIMTLNLALKGTYLIAKGEIPNDIENQIESFGYNYGAAWHLITHQQDQVIFERETGSPNAFDINVWLDSESKKINADLDKREVLKLIAEEYVEKSINAFDKFANDRKASEEFVSVTLNEITSINQFDISN